MKQLTWEEYYDGFYDWSSSTQKSYAYRLSDYCLLYTSPSPRDCS